MLDLKRTLHPGHAVYRDVAPHALPWRTVLNAGVIAAAFLFVAGLIFGAF